MSIVDIRNTITKRLEDYLGCPVKLSDQASPVPEFPYGYYSVTTPYGASGEHGDYTTESIRASTQITITRKEKPSDLLVYLLQHRPLVKGG